jgi:hypothetical protein
VIGRQFVAVPSREWGRSMEPVGLAVRGCCCSPNRHRMMWLVRPRGLPGAGVVANIEIARELAGWCWSQATLTLSSEPVLDRPRFGQRPGMVNFAMQLCGTRKYEADFDYVGTSRGILHAALRAG